MLYEVITLAVDGTAFLAAWELMALSGFVLIAAEHHRPAARSAAFVYLVATHLSTLLLWWLFSRFEA